MLPVLITLAVFFQGNARADTRHFVWSYESTTAPRGSMEYEQWVTWKTNKPSDDLYERLDFRQEFEFLLWEASGAVRQQPGGCAELCDRDYWTFRMRQIDPYTRV